MSAERWRDQAVCIVDDDANIREIYRAKFEHEGFIVTTAENGEVGLQLIREQRPDVILLDLQMPVMDGVAVLQELKADEQLGRIPVIVFSNVEDDAVFQKVVELGAARYYLIKSLTELQKVIDITIQALAETEADQR